jgi:asparagine synthase (glutamine-hydrolysing)
MCGIAAAVGTVSDQDVASMLHRMAHRGPDGEGAWSGGAGVLGHRRLSIIDAAGGGQPMTNERGDLAVSFNGEIYNHLELRRDLEPRHRFRTRSDTEVLLHLFEDEGEDMLGRLDGMFAFALVGPRGAFFARDPLGIKPLYLGRRQGVLYAASEMKALPAVESIEALPAGHAAHGDGPSWAYALPEPRESTPWTPGPREAMREIRRLVERAVQKRLMSDVPVGVLLSGGLDSSIIAALMRPHALTLHTFTAGVEGAPDLEASRAVSRALGTVHHELVYTKEDVLHVLPEVISHLESFDAPLVRSAVPMYFVCKLASDHVKVALAGEGADELFAGYDYLRRFAGTPGFREELAGITARLQDTNLQRADRMSMAHGLEVRVPFLDLSLVRFTRRLPAAYLEARDRRPAKWLLREACRGLVADETIERAKLKFSDGAGSSELVAEAAREAIDERTFLREREVADGISVRSPEELFYYRIWRDAMPLHIPARMVGRTRDRSAAAGVDPWRS